MPSKCPCTGKKAVEQLHQRNLDLMAFWTILQVSVKWNLFMSYSTCLARCTGLYLFSCASEVLVWGPISQQGWQAAEDRLCKGNVLRCPVGKAARLVSGHILSGNLGTCLLYGVVRHEVSVPALFCSKIWLNALWQCSLSFGSICFCPSPRGRDTIVRLYWTSNPTIRLP